MNEKPRLTQVRPDEEKALLDYQGDLLVPDLIHGDDGNWYADADELRLWRATRQSDVNRSALADGCIAERANSLLPISTSATEQS